MATAAQMVELAASQIGYSETPAGSNRTKYGEWYGLDGNPWCDMFVSWCGDRLGASDIVGRFAYTPSHANWFKRQGRWRDRSETPDPGEVAFFASGGTICHVGFVESAGPKIVTIEGNTSVTSNDNGGSVMRRERSVGTEGSSWYIAGYGIPDYDTEPSGVAGQEEDEMVCIIQPNGKGYLAYFDGSVLHKLTHPDQVTALDTVYQQTHGGASIPTFALGTKDAPWATRLLEAVSTPLESI